MTTPASTSRTPSTNLPGGNAQAAIGEPSAAARAAKDALTTALLVIGLGTPIVLIQTQQSGAGVTLEWRFGLLVSLAATGARGLDALFYDSEDLSGLPPAYISTMEFDPLRDEGVLYALKLMQAGIPTELHSFPGTFHGSSLFATAQVSQRESAEMFVVLQRGLQIDSNN